MLVNEVLCAWDLSEIEIQDEIEETRPDLPFVAVRLTLTCPDGHAIHEGDLICPECLADIPDQQSPSEVSCAPPANEVHPEIVTGWETVSLLPATDDVRQRYSVRRTRDGRHGLLTVYRPGSQPDSQVYEALQNRVPREHIVELIEYGELNGQYYDVTERIDHGSLTTMSISPPDFEAVRRIVEELSTALASFMEVGLRHRTLHPEKILVRSLEPLDLVITGFESGRLSEADLETESLLDISRYTAPEAVMGGVTSASDWWGLGMILLGVLTQNRCFANANDQLFLIHMQASGISIPEEIDPRLVPLLRGLLTIDRTKRWQWKEVREWLAGGTPPVLDGGGRAAETQDGPEIVLANQRLRDSRRFAIEASRASNWNEACDLLTHGQIGLWAEELKLEGSIVAGLRQLGRMTTPDAGLRLGLALQLLNRHLPLIYAETIVTPAWLLNHPELGYELITSFLPDLIRQFDIESNDWLLRLSRRAASVRSRAELHEIELDEDRLRVLALSASHPLLARQWQQRRQELPDASHPVLASLMERDQHADEDLILLLSASLGQFYSAEELVARAQALSQQLELPVLIEEFAREQLRRPRRELYLEVDDRIKGFARCGHSRLDGLADHFRMEHRLPLPELLLLLTSKRESWEKPQNQDYVASVLGFFEKKVSTSNGRGPLVRMTLGKTTPRIDVREFMPDSSSATALLTNLLQRTDKTYPLDSRILLDEEGPERRIRSLLNRTTQYLRDTGINGAYIGFPFVLLRATGARTKPRLAPVLLWPVKLAGEIGSRANFSLTFDRDRGSISINPAFDGLYGLDGTAQWKSIANELLSRSSITPAEVIDAFGSMAKPAGRTLVKLPKIETTRQPEEDQIICSAVLFHLQFTGQSLVEDLRQLKQRPVNETPLETMLRVRESLAESKSFNSAASAVEGVVDVSDQFLVTESDPSQEEAIARASRLPGLVVQGPPGTGKSQTIVNLVANSIGHQKRVLIVCQKLPALEVVRKRLVAENLGNRLVMLTNITSERRPLLLEIRSQLEELQLSDSSKPLQREQEARQLESQIRKLEQEIDSHHTSIYEFDPVFGRSYRQILAELIDIEESAPAPVIDVVGLRMLFRNRPASELVDCEEACRSLAEDWYAAHYEESPLAATQSFAHDQAAARELQRLLELFAAAEQEREAIPPLLNPELGQDCPEQLESWLTQHQGHFLEWTDESLHSAAALFSLFQSQGRGNEYMRLLELRLELSSNRGSLSALSPRFSEWISQFDEQNTKQIAEECARHAALWLSSNFEENSLSVVRLTSPDPEEIEPFRYRLERLSVAEDYRLKSLITECPGIHVDSPEPLTQWLAASEYSIRELVNMAGGWIATLLPLEENGGLCGRYAEIVREWSELSGAVPHDATSLPQLEQVLSRCPESRLARVIHDCSAVVHLWVKEPLDSLLLSAIARFPQNQMECFAVQDAIQRFINSEQKRNALLEATPQPLQANDVEGLRQWLLGAEELLMQASETTYEDAVRWKAFFRSTAGGVSLAQEIRQQLVEQIQQIQQTTEKAAVDHQSSGKLSEMDDASLDELASLIKRFKATPVGLLGIRRRWAAGPLQRCLRLHRLAVEIKEVEALDAVLQQELKRRRILLELNQLVSRLTLTIQSADWSGIIDQARQISQRLVNAFQMCKVISKCPVEHLKSAFTQQEFRPSVLKSLDAISESLEIQDAIATSRHALQTLRPFMSSTWLEWQSQTLTKGRLASAHLEYLESLSAALPTLAYSSALRVRLADCDPLIPAILSTLDSMRPSLELRSPESLAHEISQILRWHALSGRKRELESLAPPLQRLVSVGASDSTQLLNQLAAVSALSSYVKSCPIPGEFRKALSSNTAAAVEDFMECCRIGIDQSRARQTSWTALAGLDQQFDRIWIEECHAAIASNQSNSERLAPLIKALPGLPEYIAFRALADRLDSRIRQAFSLLAEARESLLRIPEHELATHVSYAIRFAYLTQRQSSMEAVEPPLRNLNATSLDGTVRALEVLRSSRQLIRRIEQCPLSGTLRSAVVAGSRQRLAVVLQDFNSRVSRAKAIDCSLEQLSNLQDWMTPQWSANARLIIQTAGSNLTNIQELIAAIPNLRAYQIFRARSASLSELHFKVFRLLSGIRSELSLVLTASNTSQLGQMVRHLIRRETLLSWKNQIESRTPALLVSRQTIAAKVLHLRQLDQKLRELNRQRISSAPLDSVASSNQWEDITRLSGPRARRLREFFHLGRELGLLALRPIWMMTPDVASQLLPLEKSIFDLVIFDEASQMPVEYALPSLYRANSAVVSGDEKQMPPSAFFSSRIESDESEWTDEEELDEFASEQERKIQEQAWNRREVKDCPDLLHLSLASLPQTTLQIHYRSAFRELIGYSNAAFYRNELGVPVRHPDDSVRKYRPIEYVPAEGIYENQQNPEEAKRVVEVLAQIWQESNGHRPSVGIVTFNLKQADLIEELLEERAEQDEEFRKTYAAEQDRKDQGEEMSLFVKNVENVQGDERDYILFSTTFGRTRAGLFRRNFGVLGNAGGERRLNVAVTRARRKVIIVGSMPIDEISDMIRTRRRPETPRDYLQAYFHYATLVSNGQLEESRRLVERIAPNQNISATSEVQLDSFKQSVANFVHTLGHELVLTADDPVLGVDFSIRDPHTGEFGMAIECDPPQHRLIRRARAREIWRPSILAGVYPIIHQVSAYAWYHAPQEERDRLRRQLDHAFSKPGERS